MDVVVEVGGWEHECCGEAIERNQLVDFQCIRYAAPDGRLRLVESHHDLDVAADQRVQGRVIDLRVTRGDGSARQILRVPSGNALLGFDDRDDGHLEDPWSGDVITTDGVEFLVTVRT